MSFVFAAESDFDPQHEFLLDEWIPIHIGAVDGGAGRSRTFFTRSR